MIAHPSDPYDDVIFITPRGRIDLVACPDQTPGKTDSTTDQATG